jgi:hypothetical protein
VALWSQLYLLTWLAFIEIWLGFTPIAPPVPEYVHIALGVVLIGLAYRNSVALRASEAPGRIKRTSIATFRLTILMALLGGLLYLRVGAAWPILPGISVLGALTFLHFVNAMAILAQAAAVGIAYDMWEDREFEQRSRPGEVPAQPTP